MLAKYDPQRELRAVHFVRAWGRLLCFLFANTVVTRSFYSDDGSCEASREQSACAAIAAPWGTRQMCQWDSVLQYCVFHPPSLDFGSVVVVSLAIVVLSIPVYRLLEHLLDQVSAICHALSKLLERRLRRLQQEKREKLMGAAEVAGVGALDAPAKEIDHEAAFEALEYWQIDDEMMDVPNLASKMILSARLRKMQQYIDF